MYNFHSVPYPIILFINFKHLLIINILIIFQNIIKFMKIIKLIKIIKKQNRLIFDFN